MDWDFSKIVRRERECKQGDFSNNVRCHGEQIGLDSWISEAGNNPFLVDQSMGLSLHTVIRQSVAVGRHRFIHYHIAFLVT